MTRKRFTTEQIIHKLRQAEVEIAKGRLVPEACKQIDVSEQTFYRWRKQYGGMGAAQLKELKRLQKENERLRRAVSDLTLDKLILAEAARGNF
jgi:transposase-like protein